MVNRSNLKVLLLMAGIFVSGAGTGAAITQMWSRHHLMQMLARGSSFHREMRMRALRHALDLTPTQGDAISRILEQDAPTRRRLMEEAVRTCGDPLRAHKAELDAKIRAILRPDQQSRFDELAKRQAERFYGMPGHGPDGPAHGIGGPHM
jgi:Spy/CpxP family protein refolding chaperone